jgi:site-specific recombinase XerD
MVVSTSGLRELLTRIDPRRRHGGVAIGRRDRAIVALLAANLTSAEVVELTGADVAFEGQRVVVRLRSAERVATIRLDPASSAAVSAWLIEKRLYGEPTPLFNGTGPSGVREIVRRHQRRQARRRRRGA